MNRYFDFKIIALFCLVFLVTACFDIDNYVGPEETFTGEITDLNTGKPLQTSNYDCMIKLEEISWSDKPEPLKFTSRPDGTFMNTKVFKGRYVVTPVDGPFFPIVGDTIDISGVTTHNFVVVPFLNVSIVNFQQTGTSVTVDFKISSSKNAYKVTDAQVFVATTSFVSDGTSILEYKQSVNLNPVTNTVVYATTYSKTINNLKSGRTYYIRVGARSNDPVSKKYNYSEYREVVIP